MNEPARPLFSVIVPTHDRPRQLAECLRALSGMDYPRSAFEVIVVDDGGMRPVDGTIEQARGSMQVHLVRRPNGGPAAARNTGAAVARGRFLAFTDDDCRPEAGWLSAFERRLQHDPGLLTGGRTINALADDACACTSQLIVDLACAHYNNDSARARFFPSNSMALAAEGFAAVGGFAGDFRTAEDRDLCDRWLLHGGQLAYVPEAVVLHAHGLDLASFWRQHYGYGRGAWRFLRAHRRRAGGSTLEAGFYLRMLREIPARLAAEKQPARVAALLALWHVANTVGFVREAARESLGLQEGR